MRRSRKIGLILLAVFVLLSAAVLYSISLIQERRWEEGLKAYVLPEDFSQEDVGRVIQAMRNDAEFAFYFRAFTEQEVGRATAEVYALMRTFKDRKDFLHAIEKKTGTVSSLVRVLLTTDMPDDYAKNPARYPELRNLMGKFYFEDFQLTILGACYRSTYDKHFRFHWGSEARALARRLNRLIVEAGKKRLISLKDLLYQ